MLFHVLGPLEVHTAAPRPVAGKPAAVLTALLLQPNAWVPVDQLVAATWPQADAPASVDANLKTYVWHLRRALPPGRIGHRAGAYRLTVEPGDSDAEEARELAGAAARAAARGEPACALELTRRALALWRGRPFGAASTVAAEAEAERLDHLHLRLRHQLADLQLALGREPEAVATLRAVTAEFPLREESWARLVRALHAAGDRAGALLAHRRAGELLAAELGVAPGPALTDAYRVAAGGAGPRRELPRDVPPPGRTAELAAVLAGGALTVVDGPAGCGKTALVVHAAHRLAPAYPDAQFFVDLHARDTPREPGAALDRLLRGLGAAVPSDPDERAALWRSEVARRRILLVLDDAAGSEQVAPLLPAGPGCRTFVTTRAAGWLPPGAARVTLTVPPPAPPPGGDPR